MHVCTLTEFNLALLDALLEVPDFDAEALLDALLDASEADLEVPDFDADEMLDDEV